MKNIKTYEGFKDLFKKKKKSSEPISIYKDEIETFLYELKDLSLGSKKFILEKDITYCFIVRNYENKKEEIDILLEEIDSYAKSIDIIFNVITKNNSFKTIIHSHKFNNIRITNETEELFFIVLIFSKSSEIIKNNLLYSYKPNEQWISFSLICSYLNKTSFELGCYCNISKAFE